MYKRQIGDIKGGAQAGAPVYRLVSGRQMEAARRTFEHVSIDGTGSRCKTPIEMTVTIETGGELSLEVKPASYVREPVSYTHLDVYKRQGIHGHG